MRFICLKYLDRHQWEATPVADRRGFLDACLAFDGQLRESGHFFACEAVRSLGPAVGLRCSNGQLIVEEDPILELLKAQQLLCGLMFLEARDLNHVIVLVSDHPGVRVGWFEIHAADAGSLS